MKILESSKRPLPTQQLFSILLQNCFEPLRHSFLSLKSWSRDIHHNFHAYISSAMCAHKNANKKSVRTSTSKARINPSYFKIKYLKFEPWKGGQNPILWVKRSIKFVTRCEKWHYQFNCFAILANLEGHSYNDMGGWKQWLVLKISLPLKGLFKIATWDSNIYSCFYVPMQNCKV